MVSSDLYGLIVLSPRTEVKSRINLVEVGLSLRVKLSEQVGNRVEIRSKVEEKDGWGEDKGSGLIEEEERGILSCGEVKNLYEKKRELIWSNEFLEVAEEVVQWFTHWRANYGVKVGDRLTN